MDRFFYYKMGRRLPSEQRVRACYSYSRGEFVNSLTSHFPHSSAPSPRPATNIDEVDHLNQSVMLYEPTYYFA